MIINIDDGLEMGHVGEGGFKNDSRLQPGWLGAWWLLPFSPSSRLLPTLHGAPSRQSLLSSLEPGSSASVAALSAAVPSLALTSLLCLGFAICASIPVLPLQYGTFILQVISRSFLYGGNAAFLTLA